MAKKNDKKKDFSNIQVRNKKAYYNFELVEKLEAGVCLLGTEVKSIRCGLADLEGAYARIKRGELWLVGCKISAYPQAGDQNHEPIRDRKLLLHKQQLIKIEIKLAQRGFTLVPLKIYFNDRGLAKVQVALARGKRQFDKRDKLKKDQQRRDLDRDMKKYR
jgi:SsrA-binding protein